MVNNGYVHEVKFEMDGRTVIAWLPAEREQGDELALKLPDEMRWWMIEVDGDAAIQGPLYTRVPTGEEARVHKDIKDFLRTRIAS